MRQSNSDRGAVTAEFVVVLPAVLMILAISIGSMTQTEERAAVVDFVDPYFYESGYIVVAAKSLTPR